jgi:hypothetical protein
MCFLGSFTNLNAQTYITSEACKTCHLEKYNDWAASGHPYKFTIIENREAPTYPAEAINFLPTWMDNLGDGTHDWNEIAGVIGGYGWKTHFVGTDGHIVGTLNSQYSQGLGHNQINFYGGENHGWADYHPNDDKIYNYSCFKCHTTGGDTEGTWLPNVPGLGTFSEGGVGCESCHGPGSLHVADSSAASIDRVYEYAHLDNGLGGLEIDGVVQMPDANGNDANFLCGTCHNRDYKDPINSSGGFVRHHEQWDEFMSTKHYAEGFSCITCHDPHKRVIWDGDGITINCTTCHPDQTTTVNHAASLDCIDCHMPYAAKSGAKIGKYKGDVRSHLWAINTSTESMFTADSSNVKDDAERSAALSPHFSCLGCHNNNPAAPDMTIEEASMYAAGMHETVAVYDLFKQKIALTVYPNPAIRTDEISFYLTLTQAEKITIEVFSISGQMVYSVTDLFIPSRGYIFNWNISGNARSDGQSGVYFLNVRGKDVQASEKFIIVK